MMSEKSIAQVGLGYWGKNILRNLCELGVLAIACDCNEEVLKEREKEFPGVCYTTDITSIINNPEIEAVAIASPAATHYELVKMFLLAGKDVFVEKPLSLTVKDGEELVEIAERNKRILMVGHILQYHPGVIKLKELVTKGETGKIYYVYSNRLNIGKLRTEENILWSFAPHDISVILMLLEEEPIKVTASGGDYLNKGICDVTVTNLEFKNGVKGHIFVSWLHPYKEQKLVVVGSKAMVVFDDTTREKLFFYPHRIKWRNGKIPVAEKANYKVVPVENGEPLKLELLHFIECVKTRQKPKTDGREGLKVLKILEMAEKSLAQSFPVVNTPQKETKGYFVHETAIIDDGVEIGRGTKIWHFSHILKGCRIGENCVIGQNVAIGPDVTIGNSCKIQNNVSVYKGVTLEDNVFCGPSCVFTNVYNPRAFVERKHEFRSTLVKKGATIGANATIVCGVSIGSYALVGAGALVRKDVPDYAVVVGVPARQIGWVCKCGVSFKDQKEEMICKSCGSKYRIENGNLIALKENL